MAAITGALMLLKLRSFGGFLKVNWKLAVIGVLVVGIGLYHWNRSRIITNLEKEVARLKIDFANCQGALDGQNKVIDKVTTDTKKLLEEERNKTRAAIEAERQASKARIEGLRNRQLAQTCEGAIDELRQQAIGELRWEE